MMDRQIGSATAIARPRFSVSDGVLLTGSIIPSIIIAKIADLRISSLILGLVIIVGMTLSLRIRN